MNSKIRFFFLPLAAFVFIGGCVPAASESNTVPKQVEFVAPARDVAPIEVVLGSDPAIFDFGMISMREGIVDQTYSLKNGSDQPRTLQKIQTSCMCTVAEIAGQSYGMHGSGQAGIVIQPGERADMVIRFDPNAHGPDATGPVTREIYLASDDTAYPQTKIRFKGNVIK